MSGEDVIPRWLARVLRPSGPVKFTLSSTFVDRADLPSTRPKYVDNVSLGKLRAVCDGCNHGWMKDLEDAAKPLLEPMLHRDRIPLDAEPRTTLAAWATKTAAMLTLKYSKPPSAALLHELYASSLSPRGSSVWLCHVDPAAFQVGTSPVLSAPVGEPPTRRQGSMGRLTFAHVGFIVFLNPASKTVTIGGDAPPPSIVPLWPPIGTSPVWPDAETVPVQGLENVAAFMRSALSFGASLPDAPADHVFPGFEAGPPIE